MSERKIPMTIEAAARIEKANAKKYGGQTPKKTFPARAKRAADKNAMKQEP